MENKTLVVTGASKGLGREMVLYFSQKKANVILVARSWQLLQQLQEEIKRRTGKKPLIVKCDITSEDDVNRMAAIIQEKVQHVDVLVNNAGFASYRVSEKISNQEMRRHFGVNFFGAYYCIKALLSLLKNSQSGYILNVGSLFSKIALAENSVYAATKFALAGFTEGLRRELKTSGIKVGLILPGPIMTSFQENREKDALKSPKYLMSDPQKVVMKVENMIRYRQRQIIYPYWVMLATRLRYCIKA